MQDNYKVEELRRDIENAHSYQAFKDKYTVDQVLEAFAFKELCETPEETSEAAKVVFAASLHDRFDPPFDFDRFFELYGE